MRLPSSVYQLPWRSDLGDEMRLLDTGEVSNSNSSVFPVELQCRNAGNPTILAIRRFSSTCGGFHTHSTDYCNAVLSGWKRWPNETTAISADCCGSFIVSCRSLGYSIESTLLDSSLTALPLLTSLIQLFIWQCTLNYLASSTLIPRGSTLNVSLGNVSVIMGGPAKVRPTYIFDGNIWMHS